MLHAPDGHHALLLCHPGSSREAVANESARHALHGDKAHLLRTAFSDKFHLLLAGKVAERELQGLVKSRVNGLVRHGKAVVRDGDVADLSLLLRLKRRIVKAVLPTRLRAERRIVELIEINIIGLERAQARFEILPEFLRRLRAGLCRQHDFVAHRRERRADLLLAVRIGARRIKKVDAAVIRLVQQLHRFLLADALNGQTAKPVFLNDQSRLAECDPVHENPPYCHFLQHSKILSFFQSFVFPLTILSCLNIM